MCGAALAEKRKKRGRPTRPLEGWLAWRILGGLAGGLRRLPYERLAPVGRVVGDLCWALMPRYRRVALANLRRAFGQEWDEAHIVRTARASFRHLGLTLVEFVWLPRLSPEMVPGIVRLPRPNSFDDAFTAGSGAILVSAHYGNWEIVAAALCHAGYPVNTIVREADHPGLDRLINEIRAGMGERLLPRQHAIRPALQCLRRNEILALLADQNTLRGGIFVPFFGIPAATPTGPATLSIRTGAPLVPIFCVRQPDRTHEILILPPICPDRAAPPEEEIRRLTTAVTATIEAQVRALPEQWTWLHNRWKLRPDGSLLD